MTHSNISETTPRKCRYKFGAKVSFDLKAPLCHGAFGEHTGNTTLIRRIALVSLRGMPRIPVVSGNALRGILRRLVMQDLFRRADLGPGVLPGHQWDRLYAALANGGHLEGSEQAYKPERVKELREAIPPLSVFGSALYSWMLPGRMSVGFLWPRCQETVAAGILEPRSDDALVMAEELVEEISHVRHVDRAQQDTEATGVTPMPTTMETLSTGATIEGEVSFFSFSTPIERGAIYHGLSMISAIGGKHGAGLGSVKPTMMGEGIEDDTASYLEWLEQAPLRESLEALAAELEPTKTKKARKKKSAQGGES